MDTSHNAANDLLLAAIDADDHALFDKALTDKADVNSEGGKPMSLAAEKKNFIFLRDLMLAGADIVQAMETIKEKQKAIPKTGKESNREIYGYHGHTPFYRTTEKPTYNPEEKRQYKRLSQILDTLESYQKTFIETVSKIELARTQHQILQELQEIFRVTRGSTYDNNLPKTQKTGYKNNEPV